MSISSEVRKAGPFAGNDVITDFPFSFKVFSTADVLVVRADSKGAEYTLELGTDYTVSLNANQNTSPGGTVVKASPLVTGDKIVITSRVANLQPTDLTNQGGFYPAVINAALDRATIQIQQLSEKVDRSAKLPITRTEDVDALLRDIVVLADNLSSVNTVAGSIGSVNKVAGVSADVSTVAGNTANINAAVADLPALSAKVSKTGDTMTGPLSVPAGASGTQVPQAQEVVPRAGGVALTGPLEVPAGASGAQVPQAQETYGPKNGQLAGMRNKIINGAFGVNQRGYVSGAATTAGQYTLDRWKVTGTGGITFSTTDNKTTVTIPSGQTLQQVIEGLNLQTGTYVLSWEGTAQGRIAGGSYGASGAVTASITGGTNTTIEFNSGTVANVQLELGTIATPFEHRPYGAELALCQRYYEKSYRQSLAPGATTGVTSADALCLGDLSASAVFYVQAHFLVEKRGVPTIRVWDAVGNIDRCSTQAGNNQIPSSGNLAASVSTRSFNTDFTISGMTRLVALCWDASAEL